MKSNMNKLESFVSVIWVVQDDLDLLKTQLVPMQQHLEANFSDYEILLVDQRSSDGTAAFIDVELKKIPCVRFIEMAFRVQEDVALVAGLENSIGDYVVLMQPANDPCKEVRRIVEASIEGEDIVYGVAPRPQSFGYSLLRPLATSVLSRVGYNVPKNATGFMVISRRVANAVMSVGRFHHQFFVRLSKTGYGCQSFPYERKQTSTDLKRTQQGLNTLIRMVIYNSTLPLRWMSVVGLLGSGSAFLFALYSFLTRLFMQNIAAGWASSVMFQSFMFMILFAMLAFFGEYLARLLDDQSGVKNYSVVYEKHSSVLLNEDRHNVLHDSVDVVN